MALTPKKLSQHLHVVGGIDLQDLEPMTIADLKRCLSMFKKGPLTFMPHPRLMLPETATFILKEHNWGNRKMRDRKVIDYSDFMRSKNWSANNTAIGFGMNGRLLDGQQRCKACEAARTPFPVGFCFGMPDDAFDTIDMGASRGHEDVCKSLGAKYPKESAVAIRWVQWIILGKVLVRKPVYSPQELPVLWDLHRDVENWIPDARKIVANTEGWISAGVVAAFLYVFHDIDTDLTMRFAEAWQTGVYREDFLGLRKAQLRLVRLRTKYNIKGGDAYASARAGLIILAWNAARSYKRNGKQTEVHWTTDQFHVAPHIDGGPAQS